jgi:hypothetical protein
MKRFALLLLYLSIAAPAQELANCMSPKISLFGFCLPARHSAYQANVNNTTMLNPACPLTLTGIYMGQPERTGTAVSVHFVNATDKRVLAVKLGLTGFDATRDPHDFSEPYALAVNLKPRHEAQPIWRVSGDDFELNTAGGARAYLTKVVFTNGETWEDDGTKSCSLTIQGIPHVKHHDD